MSLSVGLCECMSLIVAPKVVEGGDGATGEREEPRNRTKGINRPDRNEETQC